MTITTEEFIARFHSVSGTTTGERRKSLFIFLNQIERTRSNDLNLSHLIPKTPLEEKFKVETLIYFRKLPDLLEVLKSENPILIERILSAAWFVEEAFQNIAGDELVTLIFPYMSFNAKQKLLNKLSSHLKNLQQADTYFEAVEKKYGLYLASKLLPACSPDTIINCIKFKRIKLTPRQLLAIIKKNPEITESIFKVISSKNVDVGDKYKSIFLYLAQHDVDLFLKLYVEYSLSLRLGWRKTNKIIQVNRQDVINNPNKYYKLLHNKQIAKSLNWDFKDLYRNLFPESLEKLRSDHLVFSVINKLPRKMRNVNLLFATFENVYGSQLWDHENYRDLKFLEMLPLNEREVKLQLEYKPHGVSDEEWYCYMKTNTSIPYLKKTISLTSDITARVKLVRFLVKTCYLNEDKVALLHTCKYMITKHRNDNASVRRAFLSTLKQKFKLEHFDEDHWTVIHELTEIFTLNQESFDDAYEFVESYIHFCLKHDLPIKKHLTKWLETYDYNLNIIKQVPQYEKQCLLMFGEMIPELYGKGEEGAVGEEKYPRTQDVETKDFDRRTTSFLKALIGWNKRHPEEKMSIFSYPYVITSINRSIIKEEDRYDIADVIRHCLQLEINSEEKKSLLNLYLTRSAGYLDATIIKWLVEHEPLTIIHSIDAVTRSALNTSYYRVDPSFFWKWWRNYTHLENSKGVINICLSEFEKIIKESSYSSIASNAVTALSYLMAGEEFKKFIVPYYPSGLRADGKSKESETVYNIQKYICGSLKNLNPSSSALESILIFCKGDYLKLVQRSLYSVSSNVNEDKLVPFFNELSGRAVSIRKHAMHLAFRVLDKEQIYSVLKKFMETEKNPSICKFIFKGIFNFFVLNADDYSWEMVKLNVNSVDINDTEALEILMQYEKIPLRYIVQYVVFTWGILNKLPDSDSNKESKKDTLLCSITSNVINLFPREFCKDIIEKYFFKSDDGSLTVFQSDVHAFTCRYIIYCDSATEQEERLQLYFEVVKKFVLAMWHKSEIREEIRNYVGNFLKEFCLEYLKNDCKNTEILDKFANLWNSFFKSHQAFSEYLHLQFTLIYVEKLTLPQIGQKLASLFDSLTAIYGFAIVHMFLKKIKFFSCYFLTGEDDILEENWYVLIESLIRSENSVYHLVLVILLLSDHKPTIPKTSTKYQTLIEILEKNTDPVLQLYLENHFRGEHTTLDYY